MNDPSRRYAASADHYHRHRPSYPPDLIDWIVATTGAVPPARVVDVGCGTGIATRLLAQRGFDVVGVDPSEDMLAFAREAGHAQYVRGDASATGLPASSVDLVTAAQSLHWFDLAAAFEEFRRILRPSGACVAFWNLRAATPLMDEYDRLLQTSSEYDIMVKQDAAAATLRKADGVLECREAEFANGQRLDLQGLIGRAYSSSCVANGVSDRAAFEDALAELFARHQSEGLVEFRYRTVALCWRLSPGAVRRRDVAVAVGPADRGTLGAAIKANDAPGTTQPPDLARASNKRPRSSR
jgi:SAM-dependent methyltransferase